MRAVGEAVQAYADNMYIDPYGDGRQYEFDMRIQERFKNLAEHLIETAHDTARVAKISRILER